MRKYILPILGLSLAFSPMIEAKDLSGVKIYINPGHGGYNMTAEKNDRNIPTIPFEPLDENGFWESSCNLVKGLELQRLLTESGATVMMSRTQNRDEDDKDLSEIAEEANSFGADAFISVHSNALGSNNGTNYLLCLYKGVAGGAAGEAAKPVDKEMADMAWDYLYDNNITVWTGNFSPDNPCIKDDYHFLGYYLGVMNPLTVPGFLVEGSFHDYEPETHRLLNDDYAELTAVCLHRFFCDYFGAEKPGTGVIAGSVKDSQRVMTHQRFNNYVKKSHDQYQPLNGAEVTLMDASGNTLDTYTTDQYYNGVYVFRDLVPGSYKVRMEADGYVTQEKDVTVEADKTTSFYTLLEDPNYIPPAKVEGKPNIYASGLKATQKGSGIYNVEFTLNADADNVEITVYDGDREITAVPLGARDKGVNDADIDLSGVDGEDFDWTVTASAAATTAEQPLKFTDSDENIMSFKEARGIAVDNSMESPYFGRVYVSESAGGAIEGFRTTTDGIYVLDATLSDVTGQGDKAYAGNVDWSNSSSPMRLFVADDGTVYITDWSDGHSGVWMMDPADPAGNFNPVFAEGVRDASGLMSVGGVAVHGSISSCYVEGTDENTVLYTFDEDYAGDGVVNKMTLLRYDIGNLEIPWGQAPSAVVFDNADLLQQNGNSVIYPDNNGGWWISQYRYTDNATIPSLIHVDAEGAVDFNSGNTGLIGTSQQGAMAINEDGTLLAMGCADEVKIFEISYGDASPSLTQLWSIAPALGSNSYSLAFDCADNVYLASGLSCGIGAWAIPKDNNSFTTKAPADMRLGTGLGSVGKVEAADVNVVVQSGQMYISSSVPVDDVKVFGVSGIVMYEESGIEANSLTIDVSEWSKGIYFVLAGNKLTKIIR